MTLSAYERGAYKSITPGGHRYSLQMRLAQAQEAVLGQIIDFGFSVGAPEESMSIIATIAYKESSFGLQTTTSQSNARGVFQFMPASWADRHSTMDRESNTDQITAIFSDIEYFRSRYTDHLLRGVIPGTMPFAEYAESCHYSGPFHPERFETNEDLAQKVRDFNDKRLILALHVE